MENTQKTLLDGKKILVVDDEPDVLESIEDLLSMCKITKASTFQKAWQLIGTQYFDIVILDIMGVDGYRLLNLTNERGLTAVMLTAHALSPDNVKKSFEEGAALYIPKDEMARIDMYLTDVLEAKQKNKSTWGRWRERFDSFFAAKFEADWKTFDKSFFDQF